MVPLLVPGHPRSKHPRTYVPRFYGCLRVMTKEIYLQKEAAEYLQCWETIYFRRSFENSTVKKHSDNNQFFCSLDDYVLCHPDPDFEFIPGTTESFTVEKYREEFLWNPDSKVDLFLFNSSVYGNCSIMKNSKIMLVAVKVRNK